MVAAVPDTARDTDTKYNQRLTKRLLRKGTNWVNKVAWTCQQCNLVDLRIKARGADIHIQWIHVRIMTDFQRMLTAWLTQLKIWFRHCLEQGEYCYRWQAAAGEDKRDVQLWLCHNCDRKQPWLLQSSNYLAPSLPKSFLLLRRCPGTHSPVKTTVSKVLWLLSITTDFFFLVHYIKNIRAADSF